MDSFWEFFSLALSTTIMLAYLVVLFHLVVDLFSDRSVSGALKALWVVGLLLVPLLTALLYLVVRGGGMVERRQAAHRAVQEEGEAWIRSVAGASPSDEIAKARALLDAGTITDQEYAVIKGKALAV